MERTRILILGAAGRDFHNFNCCFLEDERYQVVAFTATQIPAIEGRRYPTELAGSLYPKGIPILDEHDLDQILFDEEIAEVVFAYSDVSHGHVMHLASRAVAAGVDFRLFGAERSMVSADVPVVSICAVRTGCGKSQTTRRVVAILRELGKRVVVVRHPMPYGDLAKQRLQRFDSFEDLDVHECTIEEREEYEPHLQVGAVVYAGIDYADIAAAAGNEAEFIIWDGGNNDLPLIAPSLEIVVTDPHRTGDELSYYPGEVNLRRADVLVINKIDTASLQSIQTLRGNIRAANPSATLVEAASPIFVDEAEQIAGKRVLVIEDGPTLTHGSMSYGAGAIAARKHGAVELVDPRPFAVGSIAKTFAKYPQTEDVLPAMEYGAEQIAELQQTINATPCELVLIATPIDLRRLVSFSVPALRVTYELQEIGTPTLREPLATFVEAHS